MTLNNNTKRLSHYCPDKIGSRPSKKDVIMGNICLAEWTPVGLEDKDKIR